MPVQYMHDGDEARVTVDGLQHTYVVEGEPSDPDAYQYVGPAAEEPDAAFGELMDHVTNVIRRWQCDECGESFPSKQHYAAHFRGH